MSSEPSNLSESDGIAGNPVPDHVAAVREGLLNFDKFIGLEAGIIHLQEEESNDEIPLSAYKADGLKASQRARDEEFLSKATKLLHEARRLNSSDYNYSKYSCEWEFLLRDVLTSRMEDACGSCPELESVIEIGGWDPNNFEATFKSKSVDDFKVDSYLGFKIHDVGNAKVARFGADISSRIFSFPILDRLAKEGLRSVPNSCHPREADKTNFDHETRQRNEVAFPWCIIHNSYSDKSSSKSAENRIELPDKVTTAASTALSMLEILSRFADLKHNDQHIPPVVAITYHGSKVTVWLAYFEGIDAQHKDHNIEAIWEGDLSNTWNAIQFCRILDSLLFWAHHILKPKISQYLEQWMLRYRPETPNLQSRLETDAGLASVVGRVRDRLGALGLSSEANLPALVEQAVLLQEVMRGRVPTEKSVSEEPANLSASVVGKQSDEGNAVKRRPRQNKGDFGDFQTMKVPPSVKEDANEFTNMQAAVKVEESKEPYTPASHFPANSINHPTKSKEKAPKSASRASTESSPKPCTANTFSLSFTAEEWWGYAGVDMTSIRKPKPVVIPDPEHLFSKFDSLKLFEDKEVVETYDSSGRSIRIDSPKKPKSDTRSLDREARREGERQLRAGEGRQIPIRVPWKGKCIIVRLPPTL